MGPSVGFVRGYLSILSLAVAVLLLAGVANELLGLGLFEEGYPVSGGDFGSFALGWGGLLAVLVALNAFLHRIERPPGGD